MEERKIIIIGAGITGLCTGCYLQMNGYKTEIHELWQIPGGLCTSWKRKGYTFDGCIHWLVGSGPSNNFHKLWNEIGAVQDTTMVDFDKYVTIEYEKGKIFTVYTDMDKLLEEMVRIAPEDEDLIREFIKSVKAVSKVDMPIEGGIGEMARFMFKGLPFIKIMGKYGKITMDEYAAKFKNSIMRERFKDLFMLDGRFPVGALMMMLSWMYVKSAGYPIGGSLEFIKTIEKNYLNLGGSINYNSKVTKILVEDNKAVGIKLQSGKTHNADIVVSAADGHYTIFEMLEGKYVDEEITNNYKILDLFEPIIQVSIGVNRTLESAPHSLSFPIDKPIVVDDKNTIDRIGVRIWNFDPTMAPEGKTSITSVLAADYEYWTNLRESDKQKYDAEKDRIAHEIIDALEEKFGHIKENVEVYDTATPATYIRYTNNWKASWEGWLITPKVYGKSMKKTLPGLDNFYMAGQWVEPGGGLPNGLISARNVTKIICKKDGRKFCSR